MNLREPLLFVPMTLFVAAGAGAQAAVGPWTLALTAGNSYGNVVTCASNAGGIQNGACVTVKAESLVWGPQTSVNGSACNRVVDATTTLTVGPGPRYVNFGYTLVGLLNDQAPGENCSVAATVYLNGNAIVSYSPLPPGQLTPCLPGACAPLPVNNTGGTTLCLSPGAYTVVARLGTYVTDTMLGVGQSTTSDFMTGGNSLVVCVTDQGSCSSNPLPEFIGFGYNSQVGATSRNSLGTAAGEVMTRIDSSEHAGWGTDLPGRRTIVSLFCVVQDQEGATPATFDVKLYPEDPANPGFPNLNAGVVFAVGVPGPTGTGIVAVTRTITPAVPVSVPITGNGDIFVSFVLPAEPGWPSTDGLSVQVVLGYAPNATFTIYDTPGAAQGGTPPPPATPANSHALSWIPSSNSLVYSQRRHNLIDIGHHGSGGIGLAITNQSSFPTSNNPPPAGWGPAPGTGDFLSGANPDVVGFNPGRQDDICMEYHRTGIGNGTPVLFLMDLAPTFGVELPMSSFVAGSTGVACLNLGSMQTIGLAFSANDEAFLVTTIPASIRTSLAGLPVHQQAASLDTATGRIHASPCDAKVF